MSVFSALPLRQEHLVLLSNAGFYNTDDLKDFSPTQLSEVLKISCLEASDIIEKIKKISAGVGENECGYVFAPMNAFELFEKENKQVSIVTFCEQLDEVLGGGVPTGKITEFCGPPGIGKTQMGMQLAVDVQIPDYFGGLEGKAIYIDTEGSFIIERVYSLSAALVKHLNDVNDNMCTEDRYPRLSEFTVQHILSNIHVYRCRNYIQLIALTQLLPSVIKSIGQVRLVVVDSIAFPFRHDFEDLALRSRILNTLAQSFIKIAFQSNLAVVFMNQMTTTMQKDKPQVPALGESWGHACTIRVILFWEGNSRLASLYKSPSWKQTTVAFQINVCAQATVYEAGFFYI